MMPSYPNDHWDDDWAATEHLESLGFTFDCHGIIRPPVGKTIDDFDERTVEAVKYMCGEWDYGYTEKGLTL